MRWYRIELDYAVFAIEAKNDFVVRTAPIAKWMKGKRVSKIKKYVKSKGGRIHVLKNKLDLLTDVGRDYEIVYADPPWDHWGDPNKNAAAGKHYELMTYEELCAFPVREIMAKRSALFCWMTSPRLDFCMDIVGHWDLYYRGILHIWVKTRKSDGKIIHGQGIRPTFTKPEIEILTAWTTNKRGRPFPILSESHPQVVGAPRGEHSEKPAKFRNSIITLCGDDKKMIELFATKYPKGRHGHKWDVWGKGVETRIAA